MRSSFNKLRTRERAYKSTLFININFVLNVSNTSNIVVFDKANSVIDATIAKMLRNSILLISRKINFKRVYGANSNDKKSKT